MGIMLYLSLCVCPSSICDHLLCDDIYSISNLIIFSFFWWIIFKLGVSIDIGGERFGNVSGQILLTFIRVMALDVIKNVVLGEYKLQGKYIHVI